MKKFRKRVPREEAAPKAGPVTFSPFKDLKKMLADRAALQPQKPVAPARPIPKSLHDAENPTTPLDDEAALRQAYLGVKPLAADRHRIPVTPVVNNTIVSEDAEVLASLSDLVSGSGNFDLTETEEYVEGMRIGLDPRLVVRLRAGEFAVRAHVDLHGMTRHQAKEELTAFILDSVRKGYRAVLVVHGRGLGSPGGRPVLKHAVADWLSHGAIGGHVLAFSTARQHDGGAGAMYVLLRLDRRRAPFDVLHGAKRRD